MVVLALRHITNHRWRGARIVFTSVLLARLTLHSQVNDPDISKLKAAAESGDSHSQVALGLAYQNGRGVEANDAIAKDWYQKAAAAGNSEGQNDLGVMYMNGWGIEKNKEEAVRWYRLAAKQRNAHAMFNLGAAYYNGDGVPVDDSLAYVWFLLAQEAGSAQADDAVRRSAGGSPASAPTAFATIATMYEKGEEIAPDQTAALRWLRNAAEAGDLRSGIKVASLLLFKKDASAQDYAEGLQRCQHAAKLQYAPGAFCLAYIYQHGLGVPPDAVQMASWLTPAAELGHPQGMMELSKAYWKGTGVKPDIVSAYMWARLATDLNLSEAALQLALIRKELDPKQYKKAEQKAADWKKQHRFLTYRSSITAP